MDDEIESAMIAVRTDRVAFSREVAAMRAELEGGLGEGAERAGRRIESALAGAIRTGRLGFEDLRRTALGVLSDIAAAAIHNGLDAIFSGGSKGGGGLSGLASQLLAGLLGAPGRATGGAVVGGRAYRVGERGPELFVPAASGRIDPSAGSGGGGAREVRVTITVNAQAGGEARALARSGRQVARAVRGALERA